MRREPPTQGLGLNLWPGADIEIDAGAADIVVIPDAAILFNADFRKAGKDLLILGEDGRRVVVHDYFADEKRPALASRDGATVSAFVVEAIVKQTTPAEYAQAGAPSPAGTPIGRVEKVTGSAVAIRNGVAVELNVGDLVYQGDVVQTRAGSSLGIGFIDGTAFNLSANARMVLNEMVYDPSGTANSSLISLVNGTITFMAGQVAKTGDMRVETPVGTMGIRGTIVVTKMAAHNGEMELTTDPGPTEISSLFDPLTGRVGEVVLFARSNPAQILATITTADRALVLTPTANFQVVVTEVPRTVADQQAANNVVQQVVAIQAAVVANPIVPGQAVGTSPGGSNTGGGQSGGSGSGASLGNLVQPGTTALVTEGLAPPVLPTIPTPPSGTSTSTSTTQTNAPPTPGASSNSPPVLSPDPGGPHQLDPAIPPPPDRLAFTDPDTSDTHSASVAIGAGSVLWTRADGTAVPGNIPSDTAAALALALTASVEESGGSGAGNLRWSFALQSPLAAFLGAGERLSVSYTLTVDDGHGGSSSQTVTIVLLGTNDAPAVAAPSGSPAPLIEMAGQTNGPGSHTLAGALTFSDVDLTDAHDVITQLVSVTWARPDGSAAGATLPAATLAALAAAIQPGGQDSTGSGAGVLSWNFAVGDGAFDFLATDERLTLTYSIGVDDHHGGVATVPITIVIVGTNDAPAFSLSGSQVTGSFEDAVTDTLTIVGQSAFSDADLGDLHGVVATPSAGTLGTVTAAVLTDTAGTGVGGRVGWFYQADLAPVRALAAGEVRPETFILTLTDPNGLTSSQTVTFNLVGENDAPVVDGVVTGSATEDGDPVTLAALANASDVDHGAALRAVGLPATLPPGVTFDAATQNFTLDPSNQAYQHLGSGDSLTVTVNYGVSDGFVTTPASVSWTVAGTNDAPVVTLPGTAETTDEDTPVELTGAAVADPDSGDVLTATLTVSHGTLTPLGSGAGLTSVSGIGTATLVIQGSAAAIHAAFQAGVTYSPAANYDAADALVIDVVDSHGGNAHRTVTLTVNAVDDEATGTLSVTGTAAEGGSLVAALTAVSDADGSTATAYQWQELIGATWTDIAGANTATLSIPSDQSYVGKQVRVVATTSDALGGTTTFEGAGQTIANVDDAPVVSAGNTLGYTENAAATAISPAATVSDADSVDFNTGSLTVALTNGAAQDQITILNQGTGAGQIGVSGTTVSYGGAAIGSFSGGANGTALVVSFTSASATPSAVQALMRAIAYANTSDNPSTLARTVTYSVSDGDGATGAATATINVTAVNDAPAPVNDTYTLVVGASTTTPNNQLVVAAASGLLINDSDVDNTAAQLSVSSVNGSAVSGVAGTTVTTAHGNVTVFADGRFTYNRVDGAFGTDTFTYQATDGSLSTTATVTIVLAQTASGHVINFGTGQDTANFASATFDGTGGDWSIFMGSSQDVLTTAWNHTNGVTHYYGGETTSDSGHPNDQVTLLFSAAQLESILSTTAFRSELQDYLDGSPAAGSPTNIVLDLSASAWQATVAGFGAADLAITAANGSVIRYSAITTTSGGRINADLPDFLAGLTGNNSNNTLVGTAGGETLSGADGHDILVGLGGNDTLNGGVGSDLLLGGAGDDILVGGTGSDILSGGSGNDTFRFAAVTDSFSGAANADILLDFTHAQDRIDFTPISGITQNAAFAAGAGTVAAHGISYYQSGNDTIVIANASNTANQVDIEIRLIGVNASTLTSSDFLHV